MISFVYFDVGGVIMKDTTVGDVWEQMKADMGVKPEERKRFDEFYWQTEKPVCCGKQSVDSLVLAIAKEFSLTFPPGYSLLHDYLKRFSRNESMIPIVAGLQKKIPIGLLTNMYPGMLDLINEEHMLPEFNWQTVVDSSVVGYMKPDRGIYEIAQQKTGLPASEILFIDNLQRNVEGARVAGLQAYWYDPSDCERSSDQLREFLRKLEVI